MIVENGLARRYNERTPEAAITPHRGFVWYFWCQGRPGV